ncbi:unnamed protein product [Angiostrongylus costaricensis]|uniref:Hemimethylated DNA-binding domain-containing protein n=1 Tax=Angiostrongylus costaricensis TaxID=334426 RepID=A0A3P7JEW1_ANGCS|nr:unnamed protein product [Angiostrongylus costaricensis]
MNFPFISDKQYKKFLTLNSFFANTVQFKHWYNQRRIWSTITFRKGAYGSMKHGYRGVIIGWDLKAKASEKFIEKEWTNNPNYAVLIDARDRMVPQLGYVAQANIELYKGRIIHTLLNNYMEKYDEEAQKWAGDLVFLFSSVPQPLFSFLQKNETLKES